MNAGIRLIKTDKGRAEVAGRSGVLSAVQRRLLILVDGYKTMNELGAFVRVGELGDAIDCLQQLDLVMPTGNPVLLETPAAPGFASIQADGPERPATSPREFTRVREDAALFVRERLGDAGTPICAAIDRCASPDELRSMLRGIEVFVGQRLDTQTTQAFARHFGALLL